MSSFLYLGNETYIRWYNRYRLLNEADRALAVDTFEENKDFYHPICKNLVEKDLFGKGTAS